MGISPPMVEFWIRNVARRPESFWLPTASDKFYPDFVARLNDERLLVLEYKGALTAEGSDTDEKRAIGRLWESKSGGKGIFVVVEKEVGGRDMRRQMLDEIEASMSA
jgi:type III restriction enzyme